MSEKKDTPQEIDLIELFANIGNWFGKQFNSLFILITHLLYFFMRNLIWFILITIIGGIIGFFSFNNSTSYFQSDMVLCSNTISNTEAIQSIKNWNYNAVFTKEESKSIKSIEASYLLDVNYDGQWDVVEVLNTKNNEDTTIIGQRTDGNIFLQVEVYDTAVISKISTELLKFLAQSDRVQQQNKIRLQQQKTLLAIINREISDLDSLKNLEYFEKDKPSTVKLGEMFFVTDKDPKLYHDDIMKLLLKKQLIENELLLNENPFEIIVDFSVPSISANSPFSIAWTYMQLFFAIGFVVILLIDQRKFIANQFKKAKQKL